MGRSVSARMSGDIAASQSWLFLLELWHHRTAPRRPQPTKPGRTESFTHRLSCAEQPGRRARWHDAATAAGRTPHVACASNGIWQVSQSDQAGPRMTEPGARQRASEAGAGLATVLVVASQHRAPRLLAEVLIPQLLVGDRLPVAKREDELPVPPRFAVALASLRVLLAVMDGAASNAKQQVEEATPQSIMRTKYTIKQWQVPRRRTWLACRM